MSVPTPAKALAFALAAALSGCGGGLETSYGHMRGASVNGTGAFAKLLEGRGHTVRAAFRLTDEVKEWSDAIVRFAPCPGPPDREEARWYLDWLTEKGGRRMIYVPADYLAQDEYWKAIVDRYTETSAPSLKARAERMRKSLEHWEDIVGRVRPKEVGDPDEWFAVNAAKGSAVSCKALAGPWAEGIDASRAALARHETLKVTAETVLLEGDGACLAFEWSRFNGSQVLVAANGSFLLNGALINQARWPLTVRVERWLGDAPLRIAFVEGRNIANTKAGDPSLFAIIKVPPFGWVSAQLLALGLAACLARAPRLGRPAAEPSSGEDRPAAHPEALGLLLARTGQAEDARAILDGYRRWRNPSRERHGEVNPNLGRSVEKPSPSELPRHE